MKANPDLLSIGTVSKLTGVNSVTLRAWERRYGLIQPQRTPKGHRLYSQQDVELIKTIVHSLNQGLSISKISDRLKYSDDLKVTEQNGKQWIGYQSRMVKAVHDFDEGTLDAIYNEAMSIYPVDVVTKNLIGPLLVKLGESWSQAQSKPGTAPIAEEHFFSVFFRNKLGARFHHRNQQNQGPRLLLACLPGEYHEFGLLLFALAAHDRGYRLILLGGDMPLSELPTVIEKTMCDAVVLSGSEHLMCENIQQDLAALQHHKTCPIFIGGQLSPRCKQV
nr:MerR family transcriptional regulator [Gammaproteobacteria bacterium]